MIALFTDFGWNGPYVGEMKAAIYSANVHVPVIDLMHDVPRFDTKSASYLLARLACEFPINSIFFFVVDPGVGTALRKPLVLNADGRWFVGPGNGMFDVLALEAENLTWYEIVWQPRDLSSSFHGRDLFAPMAAHLSLHNYLIDDRLEQITEPKRIYSQPSLFEIIYVDAFGNLVSGVRANDVDNTTLLACGGRVFKYQRTFGDAALGECFWYINSNGLVEIAANQENAQKQLGLGIGAVLTIQ